MSLSWLRDLVIRNKTAKQQNTKRLVRRWKPLLESLEDRTLLSTLHWIGTAGGSWTDNTMWSATAGGVSAGAHPQNAADIAIFDATASAQTITIPTTTTITVGEIDFNNAANSYLISPT